MRKRYSGWMRSAAGLVLAAATILGPTVRADDVPAGPAAFTFQVVSKNTTLRIIEKSSRVLEFKNRLTDVDGFDPTILKVTAPSDARHLRVQTLSPGITTLAIVDETGATFNIEVLVIGDVRELEAQIRESFPDTNVKAVKVKDSVLLTGSVNKAEDIPTIIKIAEQFHPSVLNALKITGVQQVLLKVQVMEAQRGKIRSMGLNYWLNGLHGNRFTNISTPGGLVPTSGYTSTIGGSASVSSTTFGNATGIMHIASNDATLDAFIEALKDETLLKVLAEPNLITVNGRPADFLSGGEFPILVPQGVGTATVAYKQFGVQLVFVPTVLSSGRLRLDVAPEVSERDFTSAIVLSGTTVAGIKTRRVNTQVEMNFGETLVIAGLISSNVTAETHKVPFLGELPWVGAAFRRVRHNEAETELMILVTPEYVAPLEDGQMPPGGPGSNTTSPTDRELYIDGRMEIRRYDNDCPLPATPSLGVNEGVTVPEPMTMPAVAPSAAAPSATTSPASNRASEPVHVPPQSSSRKPIPSKRVATRELPTLLGPSPTDAAESTGATSVGSPTSGSETVPAEPSLDTTRLNRSSGNRIQRVAATRNGVAPVVQAGAKGRPGLIEPNQGASARNDASPRPSLIEP